MVPAIGMTHSVKEALFKFGFERCHSAKSIYCYKNGTNFMAMTNVVDDELIATNNNTLCPRFLNFLCTDFGIEDMGIANWYLQRRLLQNEDHSIILDQSRDKSSIAARFLPQHDNTNITKEEKGKIQLSTAYNFCCFQERLFERSC